MIADHETGAGAETGLIANSGAFAGSITELRRAGTEGVLDGAGVGALLLNLLRKVVISALALSKVFGIIVASIPASSRRCRISSRAAPSVLGKPMLWTLLRCSVCAAANVSSFFFILIWALTERAA